MKKIILVLVLFIIYHLLFTIPVNAATPTPTVKPTESDSTISSLKDRIASTVAQLKLVERRGIIGTVSEVSGTQITVSDSKDNLRLIDVDELTKFSSPSAKESFGISDITKDSKVGILGLYNKQSRRILARFVDLLVLPKVITGAVSSVDNENFTVTVIATDKTLTTVDVENVTKTLSYTKDSGLIRSGFSKTKVGQRVTAVSFPVGKSTKRMIGSRIIIFPDIPRNPEIIIPEQALPNQDKTITSSGSGKKLTPITR